MRGECRRRPRQLASQLGQSLTRQDIEDKHAVDVMEMPVMMSVIVVVYVQVDIRHRVVRRLGERMVSFLIVHMKTDDKLEIIEMPMQARCRCP